MTRKEFVGLLPDEEARVWARETPGSPADLWRKCARGDWMLRVAGGMGVPQELLVLAACACARLALVNVAEGEDRPRLAIEAAEGWARGSVTHAEVEAAANAAYAAYAAYAASNAAYAAYAANAANAAAERKKTLLACARAVRRIIPWHAGHAAAALARMAV